MNKLKYKVGDKVRIKSLDWYNKHTNDYGHIVCGNLCFNSHNKHWCGKIVTIETVHRDCYLVKENGAYWNDIMIEGLVEEENNDCEGCYSLELKYNKLTIADNICTDKVEIILQDYKLEKEGDKWFAVKKKPKYPKTYEECLNVLGFNVTHKVKETPIFDYDDDIVALQMLKRCRDAYWKIAGEEMGLGKPWKPDFSIRSDFYIIITIRNEIKKEWTCGSNAFLAFPTAEMRDAFYENFNELIEECKELL